MIHLDKYTCTPKDNLAFKGGVQTRGTEFHCNACDKYAFKIKGVLVELENAPRTAFLNNLKALHSTHAKKDCTASQQAEEAETLDSDEEMPTRITLDPRSITNWTASDVYHCGGVLPADLQVLEWIPRDVHGIGNDRFLCEMRNEYGKATLPITMLRPVMKCLFATLVVSGFPIKWSKVREGGAGTPMDWILAEFAFGDGRDLARTTRLDHSMDRGCAGRS